MTQNDLILKELQEIKNSLNGKASIGLPITDKWITRAEVMTFFDYGDTQMAAFEKQYKVITAKIGKRKFYLRESILEILEKHRSHD